MKRFWIVCATGMLLLAASCKGREKEVTEINTLEDRIDSILASSVPMGPDQRSMVDDLFSEYEEFIRNYPEDSMCAYYLFKSALILDYNREYAKEIEKLDQLATKYPESPYAPQALVAASKASMEYMHDKQAAVHYLQQIKEKYPDSPYAVNIDLQIQYVGDDDGLLRAIWAQNGNAPDSTGAGQ
ncbi:MAG: tetratricopeptide repeat protein [Chitinophagales bacterium]